MIKKFSALFPFSFQDVLITLSLLFGATFVCGVLRLFDDGDVYVSMIFVLSVFLVSRFTNGYLFGIFAAVASVVLINYIFIYPYNEFDLSISGNAITFISTLVVAIITSAMTSRTKKQEEIKVLAEKEKMRGNLLRAISHDLRTPLTSISGIAGFIYDNDETVSAEERRELIGSIREDSEWLIRMVENLLTVTKISDGESKIEKSPEIVDEICAEAIEKIKKRYQNVKVNVSVSDELMFVPMDAILVEQVIINLVENSVKHGKTTTQIDINAEKNGEFAEFSVSDNGNGTDDIKNLFSPELRKNRNIETDNSKNMGIGLSVCRTIINAHGGKIKGENISPHGLKITFTLPLDNEENGDEF